METDTVMSSGIVGCEVVAPSSRCRFDPVTLVPV
jgi:hypothetical protein